VYVKKWCSSLLLITAVPSYNGCLTLIAWMQVLSHK
jgi:hypothetical protein